MQCHRDMTRQIIPDVATAVLSDQRWTCRRLRRTTIAWWWHWSKSVSGLRISNKTKFVGKIWQRSLTYVISSLHGLLKISLHLCHLSLPRQRTYSTFMVGGICLLGFIWGGKGSRCPPLPACLSTYVISTEEQINSMYKVDSDRLPILRNIIVHQIYIHIYIYIVSSVH